MKPLLKCITVLPFQIAACEEAGAGWIKDGNANGLVRRHGVPKAPAVLRWRLMKCL